VLSSRGSSICALDSPGASSVACGGAATGCSPITPGAHGRCGPPTTACEPRRARNRCAGWCCSPERAALATSLSWQDCVERIGQALQARGYVLELIESEQADSKAPVVGAFVALERNPGGDLQAVGGKLPAVLNLGIVGIADHDAGRFEARRGNRLDAPLRQHRPNGAALLPLRLLERVEADLPRLHHRTVEGA